MTTDIGPDPFYVPVKITLDDFDRRIARVLERLAQLDHRLDKVGAVLDEIDPQS